jgi:chemotaxis protein histidine kinase CheA
MCGPYGATLLPLGRNPVDEQERGELARQRIALLVPKFVQRARGEIQMVERLVQRVSRGDSTVFVELRQLVHGIAGTGALYGFSELSARAWKMERLVDELIALNSSVASDTEPELLQRLVICSESLATEIKSSAGEVPS